MIFTREDYSPAEYAKAWEPGDAVPDPTESLSAPVHESTAPDARPDAERIAEAVAKLRERVEGVSLREHGDPPFEGAVFDTSSHRWKKPGEGGHEVIGKGSSGEVTASGDRVYKNATRDEAKVYGLLKGVSGVADATEEGGKISLPRFKNIVSVDDVPQEKRKNLAPIVVKALPQIVNALTALSDAGYDYNDPLQVGFDKDRNPSLFDFSAANKTTREEAVSQNLDKMSAFLKEFGAERQAKAVSQVAATFRAIQDPENPFMEGEPETPDAKRIASQLDGKPAKYLYYSGNGREIPSVAQSESRDGIKVIASPTPLSDDFLKQWEINPVVHRNSASGGGNP